MLYINMNKPQESQEILKDNKRQHASQAYPKKTLKDSLRIAESIKADNAGKPFNRLTLAKSLDYSPNSSSFRALITASGKYGLTSGSYAAEKIGLTPLGISVIMYKSEKEKNDSLLASFFTITLYKKFFTDFNGSRIPAKDLLINTLNRDYHIPLEDASECYDLLIKNAMELDILEDIKGTKYINLERISTIQPQEKHDSQKVEEEKSELPEISPDTTGEIIRKNSIYNNRVFITHGSNIDIVNQIKEILKFGKLEPIVAEEHSTTSIPVPHKVFLDMRSCSAAIIHVAGEDKMMDSNGKEHIILNQNVLIEIGAAMALYDKNIILLVEKGTNLPSNLQGLYRCDYEGSKLDYESTMKLLKAFNEFKLS